jgi:citrate lyase beta subunit
MIEKAKGLPADEVFLDLEDAVAPDAKAQARTQVAAALAGPGWSGQLRGVRVNDWTTPWTYTDVIDVVSAAGAHLDVIVLPKVSDAHHVQALDLLLTQLERSHGFPVGRIGIDVQIENAKGLSNIHAIAAAPRVQALVLGPADLMADLNTRTLVVGEQPEGYEDGPSLEPTASGGYVARGPLVVSDVRQVKGVTEAAGWAAVQTWFKATVTSRPTAGTFWPVGGLGLERNKIVSGGAVVERYIVSLTLKRRAS